MKRGEICFDENGEVTELNGYASNRKSFEFYENREVLHFTAQLKVI